MAQTDFTCPSCGEEVHPNANSCPRCGIRPEAGWAAGGEVIDGIDDLDLPLSDEDFDYDEFVAREFDGKGNRRSGEPVRSALDRIWVVTAIVLIGAILISLYFGLW